VAALSDNAVVQLHTLMTSKLAKAEKALATISEAMDRGSNEAGYAKAKAAFDAKWAQARAESWNSYQKIAAQLWGAGFDARAEADKVWKKFEDAGRGMPRKSMRFYDCVSYDEYNAACRESLTFQIALLNEQRNSLQKRYARIRGAGTAAKGTGSTRASMQLGSLYYKFASGTTHAEKCNFFLVDQICENFMAERDKFETACVLVGLLPWLDMFCDLLGTNSLCPFCLSAKEDAASFNLEGWEAWGNPPFKYFARFVEWMESNFGRDNSTKVILILPVEENEAMRRFAERDHWALAYMWTLSAAKVFSKPSEAQTFAPKRKTYSKPVQQIGVWHLVQPRPGIGPSLQEQIKLHRDKQVVGFSTRELLLLAQIGRGKEVGTQTEPQPDFGAAG